MSNSPFRVLYRQFLFRMVDLELLSSHAQGDSSKLFGQFASLLIFFSLLFSLPGLGFHGDATAGLAMLHILIATTMLAVGIFAVLSWDSTYPDRRDVMVLAPLPVRVRTVFLAKVAGVAVALSVTVATLHASTGLVWPLALSRGGVLVVLRSFAAYWVTMLAAGAFVFGCVLCVQGLTAQLLPRRLFLRVSSWLQMAAFCLLVTWYCLQPLQPGPLARSPSYWFLGFFRQLNGSETPTMLARRAWIGLAVVAVGTALAYTLSYLRTLRQIVEEPDIVPGVRGFAWLPRFGGAIPTAVAHFSIRTLLRSRQHRVLLAFYLGIGFAITIFLLNTPGTRQAMGTAAFPWREVNVPMLSASIVMLCFAALGTRIVFSMPIDLRANWIWRVTPVSPGAELTAARRRSILALAVAPLWLIAALVFAGLWPWRPAAGHLLVLALLGALIAELCLAGAQKIPFTCSYLPGKSNFHMVFWAALAVLMQLLNRGAPLVLRALRNPVVYAALIGGLVAALVAARRRTAGAMEEGLRFEEEFDPPVMQLGLYRDGVMPLG